jgi:deoxyribodipyrimidine photo-lyase
LSFIHASLQELDAALRARGGGLIVRYGWPEEEIPALANSLGVSSVFANRDYEPAAKLRDEKVGKRLAAGGITLHLLKDQVIFDGNEVLTLSGKPFTVFTPYKNAWLKRLTAADCAEAVCDGRLASIGVLHLPSLEELGFSDVDLAAIGMRPGMSGARARWADFCDQRILRYGTLRDYPAIKGVSYLSVHLRFGTISIRELLRHASAIDAAPWLNELIWRDFYFMVLDHNPQVVDHAFKPEYDAIHWTDWPAGLAAWKTGHTGYPLVDAAMRQLAHCGWMHNRLRMLSASFLCKDLGIDWRLGERHFAEHLIDFDLSANNGGWQWAASSGCDAQPYFRIFNPITQSEKFDAEGRFIRRYVPELARVPDRHIHAPWRMGHLEQSALNTLIGRDYPAPIVDHAAARAKTLERYAVVKKAA